jgi:hypothetical protein
VVAGLALIAVAAVVIGRVTFERRLARELREFLAERRDAPPAAVTEGDLAGLPEPVQRWLRASRVVGKVRPQIVRLKQEGEFRLSEAQGWLPFRAEEYYTTDPPGFFWSVTMQFAPLVPVRGRDRYLNGEGSIEMRLLSLIPVASKRGDGLNQGALLRYLNETMWFPAGAIAPYIRWEGIDALSARATMSYAGTTASAIFYVDREGRLTDMTAERYNDARDRLEQWSTPITGYGEFEGVSLPVSGTGVWKYETGDFPYIRLRVTEIEYNPPLP